MRTAELLRKHDVKPTIVRMRVYDYLIDKKNHPTADTVYKSLHDEIPTLSKTSIYNTMELFVEKNLIRAVTIEENETRFDADISDHGHFKCMKCLKVFDFHVEFANLANDLGKNFIISERHAYFRGTCPSCGYNIHP